MVSEDKKKTVKMLAEKLEKYPVIGLLDMFKMPGKQLHEMRDKLRGKATIKMLKKSLMKLAMENVNKKGIKELEKLIQNQPALLLSEKDPFELARIIDSSKSFAPAKEGDTAPKDIKVKSGPTPLKPGPVIGELQRAKIPAGVDGEKIIVKKDTTVVKEGETIERNIADILGKLKIEPMEIGLNLLAVWDEGTIFKSDILFIPPEKYLDDIRRAYSCAFNLAINISHITPETLVPLLSKAHREAVSLSMEAGIITGETIVMMLSKANSQMLALSSKVDLSASPEEKDKKEETEGRESKEEPPKKEDGQEKGDKKEEGKGKKEAKEEKTPENKGDKE